MSSITSILFILSIIALINGIPLTDENGNSVQSKTIKYDFWACIGWYFSEGDPQRLLAQTVDPPCTISKDFPATLPDGWSVDPECDAKKQPNTCKLHKGAYGCYRYAKADTGPGAQACYTQNGVWISDVWKGAGTVDAETPLGDLGQQLKHFAVDVVPYYTCCNQASTARYPCSLYYEKRPSGKCQ